LCRHDIADQQVSGSLCAKNLQSLTRLREEARLETLFCRLADQN